MKQLASSLVTPIFLVDSAGSLLYYNESAEVVLGRRFEETGEMSVEELGGIFSATDGSGDPIPTGELPLRQALASGRPAHRSAMHIVGLDGIARQISVTAFPLVGQAGRQLGVAAVFWEEEAG